MPGPESGHVVEHRQETAMADLYTGQGHLSTQVVTITALSQQRWRIQQQLRGEKQYLQGHLNFLFIAGVGTVLTVPYLPNVYYDTV